MKRESFVFALSATVLIAITGVVGAMAGPVEEDQDPVFATVGGVEITRAEFEREVYAAARRTFYHGKTPEALEFIEFRKDVARKMIDRELVLIEARRREIEPDQAKIDARIATYETRYGDTERWKQEGATMVASLREKFEQDALVDALEAEVRHVPEPDSSAVRAFYDENPDLFTEPGRNRVSLILLGVPSSSGSEVWRAAREEARRILSQLEDGDSFEELAELHSVDATASEGGDMGYLHSGMLAEDAEAAINGLEVGEVSEPVQVLEGIAIFKLTERAPERLRSFDDVRERASELAKREQGDAAWESLVARLRVESNIKIDDEYLATLPAYAQ